MIRINKEVIMKKLTESNNYSVDYEYEKVFLTVKKNQKRILIGEFYGDPYTALISENENFCAIGGEGLIVYYLHEPFDEYKGDDIESNQYMIWGREDNENTIWIEDIKLLNERQIEVITEDNQSIVIIV